MSKVGEMTTKKYIEDLQLKLGNNNVRNNLVRKYYVPDLPLKNKKNVKFIFVLESPHIDEIWYDISSRENKKTLKERYPAAGLTGLLMTAELAQNNCIEIDGLNFSPLGTLLSNTIDNKTRLDEFGIINISNIPLQAGPYIKKKKRKSFIKSLKRIRNSAKRKYSILKLQKETDKETYEALKDHFLSRLSDYNDNAIVIPCGRIALNFVKKENVSIPEVFDSEELIVKHPTNREEWGWTLPQEVVDLINPKTGKKK